MASAFKVFFQQSSFPFWKEYSRKNTPNLPIAIRQSATFLSIVKTSPADGKEQKLQTKGKKLELRYKMLKYALFDYIPKRKMRRATFEQQDTTRKVLDFKAGKSYATSWAARQMARAIRHNDLSDTIIVCIPASCKRTNDRRYKQFMRELCELTGAINGFDLVQPMGKRRKAHIDHVHEIADGASECIHFNDNALRGKKVLVVDDIVTTGKTANTFIDMLQSAGADVRGALFLSKTKSYRKNH